MIKVFYGNDRQKTQQAIDKLLGENYEVIEADNIERSDMDSIFYGTSLFGETRRILLKNLNENKACWESFPDYQKTTHKLIIWPSALDKRSVVYKAIRKNKDIEFKEFAIEEKVDRFLSFKVIEDAFAGRGAQALKKCEQLKETSDPFLTMGSFVKFISDKIKMGNKKAKEAVMILAKADVDMKSSDVDAWDILKISLLKISQIK